MEQKSTGWTGTGTEVDEKKSKQDAILQNMSVKNGVGRTRQVPHDELINHAFRWFESSPAPKEDWCNGNTLGWDDVGTMYG